MFFDNDGYVSFPAAFDCVIGVDNAYFDHFVNFEYVEGSIVNIRCRKQKQKLPWSSSKYVVSDGISFSCAKISALIYELNSTDEISSVEKLKAVLKNQANKIIQFPKSNTSYPNDFFAIHNAAIFPFNKEMHIILNFKDMLKFNIKGCYDINKSGRIGSSTENLTKREDCQYKCVIKNIKDIDWDAFDCLILGHCDEMNKLLIEDIREKLIISALTKGKNIS